MLPQLKQQMATKGGLPTFAACMIDCAQRVEADHRVANHLAVLSSYVHLKGKEFERSLPEPNRNAARVFTQSIDAQIQAISELHRLITSQGAASSLDLGKLIRSICGSFFFGNDGRVSLTEDLAPDCHIRADQALAVSQFVTEAITNAVKYAYPENSSGRIFVQCRLAPSGGLLIEIIDEGIGLGPSFDRNLGGGYGFKLMRGLAEALGGRAAFKSEGIGLTIRLTLPQASLPVMS